MRNQMAVVVGERDARLPGFALERLVGERDVAEQRRFPAAAVGWRRRKRQHVRRLVQPAPAGVQRANSGVVAEAKADLRAVPYRTVGFVGAGGDRLARRLRGRAAGRATAPKAR